MVHIKKSRHSIKQAKREARQKQQVEEQTQRHAVTKKRKIKHYSIFSVIGIIVLIALFFLFSSIEDKPGPHDAFAQCLTEEGATMYGAFWCPHCAEQKKMFGKSFKYVDYVECDPKGKNANPEKCNQAGITSHPTWIIKGEKYNGQQPLPILAEATSCELTKT
tara:strand:- start:43059 stop:43547 length:489 start_codon:yes stop_codon:yes gene_type:complete